MGSAQVACFQNIFHLIGHFNPVIIIVETLKSKAKTKKKPKQDARGLEDYPDQGFFDLLLHDCWFYFTHQQCYKMFLKSVNIVSCQTRLISIHAAPGGAAALSVKLQRQLRIHQCFQLWAYLVFSLLYMCSQRLMQQHVNKLQLEIL